MGLMCTSAEGLRRNKGSADRRLLLLPPHYLYLRLGLWELKTQTWVQILIPSLTDCVCRDFFEPRFPHLYSRNDVPTFLVVRMK